MAKTKTQKALKNVEQKISETVENVTDWAAPKVESALNWAEEKAQEGAELVAPALQAGADKLSEFADTTRDKVTQDVLPAASASVASAASKTHEAISNIDVPEAVEKAVGKVTGDDKAVKKAQKAVEKQTRKITKGAQDQAKKVQKAATDQVKAARKAAKDEVKKVDKKFDPSKKYTRARKKAAGPSLTKKIVMGVGLAAGAAGVVYAVYRLTKPVEDPWKNPTPQPLSGPTTQTWSAPADGEQAEGEQENNAQ